MKIFGIGLSRTGTTSLTTALNMLGYRVEHYFHDLTRLEWLDGGTDTPIAHCFEELDLRYPGSKFIYTVRDRKSWLESCARHFSGKPASPEDEALRIAIYGTTGFDHVLFEQAYERHEQRVLSHFRGREDDLLTMEICAGEGWERLCAFLDREVPEQPFPRQNRAARRALPALIRYRLRRLLSG